MVRGVSIDAELRRSVLRPPLLSPALIQNLADADNDVRRGHARFDQDDKILRSGCRIWTNSTNPDGDQNERSSPTRPWAQVFAAADLRPTVLVSRR